MGNRLGGGLKRGKSKALSTGKTKDLADAPEPATKDAATSSGAATGSSSSAATPTAVPKPAKEPPPAADKAEASQGPQLSADEQRRQLEKNMEPLEVIGVADDLGLDISHEAEMLWIAEELHHEPAPLGWMRRRNKKGRIFYVNEITGEKKKTHPLEYLYKEVSEYQRKAMQDGSFYNVEDEARARSEQEVRWAREWQQLFDEKGEAYWWHEERQESSKKDPIQVAAQDAHIRFSLIDKMKRRLPLIAAAGRPSSPGAASEAETAGLRKPSKAESVGSSKSQKGKQKNEEGGSKRSSKASGAAPEATSSGAEVDSVPQIGMYEPQATESDAAQDEQEVSAASGATAEEAGQETQPEDETDRNTKTKARDALEAALFGDDLDPSGAQPEVEAADAGARVSVDGDEGSAEAAENALAPEVCSCGNIFRPQDSFCGECGTKRSLVAEAAKQGPRIVTKQSSVSAYSAGTFDCESEEDYAESPVKPQVDTAAETPEEQAQEAQSEVLSEAAKLQAREDLEAAPSGDATDAAESNLDQAKLQAQDALQAALSRNAIEAHLDQAKLQAQDALEAALSGNAIEAPESHLDQAKLQAQDALEAALSRNAIEAPAPQLAQAKLQAREALEEALAGAATVAPETQTDALPTSPSQDEEEAAQEPVSQQLEKGKDQAAAEPGAQELVAQQDVEQTVALQQQDDDLGPKYDEDKSGDLDRTEFANIMHDTEAGSGSAGDFSAQEAPPGLLNGAGANADRQASKASALGATKGSKSSTAALRSRGSTGDGTDMLAGSDDSNYVEEPAGMQCDILDNRGMNSARGSSAASEVVLDSSAASSTGGHVQLPNICDSGSDVASGAGRYGSKRSDSKKSAKDAALVEDGSASVSTMLPVISSRSPSRRSVEAAPIVSPGAPLHAWDLHNDARRQRTKTTDLESAIIEDIRKSLVAEKHAGGLDGSPPAHNLTLKKRAQHDIAGPIEEAAAAAQDCHKPRAKSKAGRFYEVMRDINCAGKPPCSQTGPFASGLTWPPMDDFQQGSTLRGIKFLDHIKKAASAVEVEDACMDTDLDIRVPHAMMPVVRGGTQKRVQPASLRARPSSSGRTVSKEWRPTISALLNEKIDAALCSDERSALPRSLSTGSVRRPLSGAASRGPHNRSATNLRAGSRG